MLVLPHADGLRIDLYQLSQGILEAASDGDRTTQRDVHVWELIRGKLGCGVDRSTRLRDHDRSWALAAGLLQHVGDLVGQLFRLTGSGAVADSHKVHRVLRTQRGQSVYCLAPLVLRLMRIDNCGIKNLAGGINYSALHAVSIARVQSNRGALTRRCRQQDVAQVGSKDLERALLRDFFEAHAHIKARRDVELRAPAPVHGVGKPLGILNRKIKTLGNHALIDFVFTGIQVELENALVLTAQQRQDAVRGQLVERLRELEVVLKLGAFGFLASHHGSTHGALVEHALAHLADQVGVESKTVNDDGTRALESLLGVFKSFSQELPRHLFWIGRGVLNELVRQLFQAGLASDVGLGLAALLVWQVQVFQTRLGLTLENLCTQLVGELSLLIDSRQNCLFTLFQFAQVRRALLDGAQLRIIQTTSGFFAVTRDEWDSVSLRQKRQSSLNLRLLYTNLCGDGSCNLQKKSSPLWLIFWTQQRYRTALSSQR